MIVISGTVLYLAPPGRVARWIEWILLGLDRAQWETQHTLFSYLFILFGAFHLFSMNWQTFLSYLKRKIVNREGRKIEIYLALATTLLIFTLTLFKVPPIISVMDFGNKLSDTWETKVGNPPVPGIEDMSLDEIAQRFFGSDSNTVLKKVRGSGYNVNNSSSTLREIAQHNAVSPMKIFESLGSKTGIE
jgi:hypothetical protein